VENEKLYFHRQNVQKNLTDYKVKKVDVSLYYEKLAKFFYVYRRTSTVFLNL